MRYVMAPPRLGPTTTEERLQSSGSDGDAVDSGELAVSLMPVWNRLENYNICGMLVSSPGHREIKLNDQGHLRDFELVIHL